MAIQRRIELPLTPCLTWVSDHRSDYDLDDDRLLNTVISGFKTATCIPKVWYYDVPEQEPTEVGDIVAVYNQRGEHKCTIEITENYEIAFGEVNIRIAKAENYQDVEQFIKDHIDCWPPERSLKRIK